MMPSDTTRRRPLLAYFGHHKCGTTWVASICREVCASLGLHFAEVHNAGGFGRDLLAFVEDEAIDFLAYTNADRRFVAPLEQSETLALRGFHVARDPRDLVVSGYFSSLHSHPTEGWPELVAHRAALAAEEKPEGLLLELEWERHVLNHIATWLEPSAAICEIPMESLFADEHAAFRKAFEHLGVIEGPAREPTLSPVELDAIVQRHSFATKTRGRTPGQEDVKSHLRKGKAGDWVNHFDDRHKAWFKTHYGDLLQRLGYVDGADW